MTHRIWRGVMVVVMVLTSVAGRAMAWHHEGHQLIARDAARALPEDAPAFLRDGAMMIAHVAPDPDLLRSQDLPQIRSTESPEHYLDYELVEGKPLPATRFTYYKMLYDMKLDPANVGNLPYAITEWQQRLTMSLAEYRKWPDNEFIKSKCLVYAGILSHYSGDLVMPLHTTIHHDGRVVEGQPTKRGIHTKVDDLLYRISDADAALTADMKVEAYDNVFKSVMAELESSHKLVDRVYELEDQLPGVKEKKELTPAVRDFAVERAREGVRFTASLFYTAWVKSASVKVPSYFDREPGK
ncbi:MAG: hypothetical protein GC162_17100 [Planctomycetes bacterium]|nr:hypothetical protein [Planctomycetota bacterium]